MSTEGTAYIKGGYILQPRLIDESEIAKLPPHIREIWSYILRNANHSDVNISGTVIKRGQLFTRYSDIIEDLSWYVGYRKESYKKHHCDTAMRLLTKQQMITTTKTTRGLIITICNYDYYQNPKNYETDREADKKPTRNRQSTDTINKNDKNGNNENNEEKEISTIVDTKKKEEELERKKIEQKKKSDAAKAAMIQRKDLFHQELVPYVERYGETMIKNFFEYWSEPNRSQTKMRFELQKTWDLARRLGTWNNRDTTRNGNNLFKQASIFQPKEEDNRPRDKHGNILQ